MRWVCAGPVVIPSLPCLPCCWQVLCKSPRLEGPPLNADEHCHRSTTYGVPLPIRVDTGEAAGYSNQIMHLLDGLIELNQSCFEQLFNALLGMEDNRIMKLIILL